jgi:hypothetical protein
MTITKLTTLAKQKAFEIHCLLTHKHFDKATVSKCNTEKLDFDFDGLCLVCKPMRWIGKRNKSIADRSEIIERKL